MGKEASITIGISGVRGGPFRLKEQGLVAICIDGVNSNNVISANAFEGIGDAYRRRRDVDILIGQGDKEIFRGTFEELCNKIKNK